ncbi:tape measure protein [Stenotrophomonas maltophilia]|uniref:tape measure protein n=1 Tax=Stenotrophomonas maltophilia TaxID=40324 RepID=UPI00155922EF|nr:tape measure protein [Stenotrophomonas maltophilia]
MALRELVTVLRYELREGNLKKYVDGYRRAEKAVNTAAKAANDQLKRGVQVANRELASMNRTGNRLTRTMGRLAHEAREFGIGLRQGARQGYGEVLRQMDRVEARQRRMRRSGAGAFGGGVGFAGGMLQGAIQGVLATLSGKAFMDAADTWSTTKGQIALQNESPADRARTRDFLFTKAQQQGQDYSTSVGTYTRIARNRQVLGLSNDQVLQLTSTLGGMLSLGGGSAQSQQAALEQFGQAMSSGVLRGEELNSVLEGAPVLANAIAKSFGITADQLRKVAAEGKLTSKGIADGLLRQTEEVDAAMASLPMTFQRSFTQIRNQFTRLAGEINEKYQLAEKFNVAAQWVIRNMTKIGAALGAVVGSVAAIRAFRVLAMVFNTLQSAGRPLLLFFDRLARGRTAQAFSKLGGGGLRFLRVIRAIGAVVSGVGVVGAAAFALIAAAVIAAGALVYKYWEPIKAFFGGVWEGVAEAGSEALQELTNAFAPLLPAFETIGGWLQEIWDWFVRLIQPVQSTSEELENAASYGKIFGQALLFPLKMNIKLIGLIVKLIVGLGEAIGTAIGWIVVTADSAWSSLRAGVESLWNWITGKFAAGWKAVSEMIPGWAKTGIGMAAGATGLFGGVSAGSMVNAGRSAVNQTVTQTASVQVTAPPGANPAAYGAAAQRGTTKAMTGFQYQLPTAVEAF